MQERWPHLIFSTSLKILNSSGGWKNIKHEAELPWRECAHNAYLCVQMMVCRHVYKQPRSAPKTNPRSPLSLSLPEGWALSGNVPKLFWDLAWNSSYKVLKFISRGYHSTCFYDSCLRREHPMRSLHLVTSILCHWSWFLVKISLASHLPPLPSPKVIADPWGTWEGNQRCA